MKNKSRSLRRLTALCATTALLFSYADSFAQPVIISASNTDDFIDIHDPSITAPCNNDASMDAAYTLNCDMVQVPTRDKLFAIAITGMNHQNYVCCCYPNTCCLAASKPLTLLHVEYNNIVHNFNSHDRDILLPTNLGYADVVIGDNILGGIDHYTIAAIYNAPNQQEVWLSTVNANIISTGSSASTLGALSSPVILNDVTNGRIAHNPHIDLFGDATTTVGGYHALHKYIAVWSEEDPNTNINYIMAAVGDLGSPSSFTRYQVTPNASNVGPNGVNPDVAAMGISASCPTCTKNIAFITYTDPAANDSLKLTELDFSSSTLTTTTHQTLPTVISTIGKPRIESKALGTKVSGEATWQVAVGIDQGSGFYQLYRYNDVVSMTPGVVPAGISTHRFSPAVAGVGEAMDGTSSGKVGETKFSIAYYSSYTNPTGSNGDVYMQNNNISGGTFGTNEYEVNTNALAQPSSYSSENDIPLAVSNCSNNGDDLLTVWYGGWPGTLLGWGYINYKLAGNSYTFRPTGIENAIVNNFDVSAYPNPTNNSVVLKASSVNKSAKVTISNISGCIVKEIDIDQLETNINMSSLAPGVYQLRYKDDVNSKTIKVVKE